MSEENNLQSEEEKKMNSEAEKDVKTPVTSEKAVEPTAISPEEEAKEEVVADQSTEGEEVSEEAPVSDVEEKEVEEKVDATNEEISQPSSEDSGIEEAAIEKENPAEVEASSADDLSEEVASKEEALEESSEADIEEKTTEPVAADAADAVEEDASTEGSEDMDEPAHDEDEVLPDYSTYTREQLVEAIEELTHQDTFRRSSKIVEIIDPLFKSMEDEARSSALAKYIEEGGDKDSFEFRHDELFNRYDASQRLIRDRKSAFYKEKEASKERNLAKKEEILDQLRGMIDGENTATNVKPIKEIQEAWKAIGPVPNQHNRTLWANYNALLDRFYNNRHILFELKELDRKKNYAAKLDLCEKAEALDKVENIKDAIIQLNELHDEYKRLGAVPREVQEELWKRFKGASDVVYKKRKEYLDSLKGELKGNLVEKEKLIEELKVFTSFDSDRINDWNAKTKEILAIQKRWDAIGGVPREKAKEINKGFWSNFKKFFSNKNDFFKKLEGLRKENLAKKEELVKRAESFAESQDWDGTAEKIKGLQREWKTIGPVPEKQRNLIYAQFKEACDIFFNNKRSSQNEAEAQYVENQTAKEEIIERMLKAVKAKETSKEGLLALAAEYQGFGFVPRNAIKPLEEKYGKAVESYVAALGLDESDAETLVIKAEMAGGNSGGSDRKLQKKESALRRKVKELEDNIALWNNNLAFFANSKTADKLKEEFDQKIDSAEEELRKLKKQLRILRNL